MIRRPCDEEEWRRYENLARRCFHEPQIDLQPMQGHAATRLALDGKRVVAGAMALRAAAFFGGRPVSAAAIACVCVSPEARGRGLAGRILGELTSELRNEGCAVALLWTPSVGVYRRWGWEIGGLGRRWFLPLCAFARFPRPQRVEEGLSLDGAGLQCRHAGGWNAALRRLEWWWSWKYPHDDQTRFVYQLLRGSAVVGLVGYCHRSQGPWGYDLVVSDFWTADQQSTLELYGFLAGHSSQAHRVVFDQGALPSPPPFLWDLPQHVAVEEGWYPWMLRLIDIPAAFAQRGWPATLSGVLDFAIEQTDGTLRLWTVTVDKGEANVQPGGKGGIPISENVLAAWYSGGIPGPQLSQMLPRVSEHDLQFMTALTAGAGPWLPDIF